MYSNQKEVAESVDYRVEGTADQPQTAFRPYAEQIFDEMRELREIASFVKQKTTTIAGKNQPEPRDEDKMPHPPNMSEELLTIIKDTRNIVCSINEDLGRFL